MQRLKFSLGGIVGGLVLGLGSGLAAAQGEPGGNWVNAPFATLAPGPTGVTVVEVADPADGAAVQRQVRAVLGVGPTRARGQMPVWLRFLRQQGIIPPGAWEPRFPRTVLLRHRGRLVLPDAERTRQDPTQPGNPDNDFTLVYEPAPGDETAVQWTRPQLEGEGESLGLRSYVERVMPILRDLYGPPAFPNQVRIVHDPTLHLLESGVYNASTNEIRLKLLYDSAPEIPDPTLSPLDDFDFYNLTLLLLRAFHDETLLFYNAWEEGFARAVQVLAAERALPQSDVRQRDTIILTGLYDLLNRPPLGNIRFANPDPLAFISFIRIGMAQAAWLKVYAEYPHFFREFNALYYAQWREGSTLPGDVPRLKNLARSVAPTVEGLDFLDWYRRQYVLDTSVTVGAKLFVYSLPQEQYDEQFEQFVNSLTMIVYHYRTLPDGTEVPGSGTVKLQYTAFDGFSLNDAVEGAGGPVEEEIGHFDDPTQPPTGLAFLSPLFFNITPPGGVSPQRVVVDLTINGLHDRVYYPFDMPRDEENNPQDIFGLVTEGLDNVEDTGTLRLILPGQSPLELTVRQGVFAARIPTGLVAPATVRLEYTDPQGQTFTFQRNLGYDFYIPVLNTPPTWHDFAHQFPAGLSLITIPAWPQASSEAEVLGLPAEQVLLARLRPESPVEYQYQIFPDTPPFAPGLGYWLQTPQALNVSFRGRRASTDTDFRLRLGPGWQQIGNPFTDFAVAVEDLQVHYLEGEPVNFLQALVNGWVSSAVWGFTERQGYQRVTRLEPWQGYWLQVTVPEGVTLLIPPRAAQKGRVATPAQGRGARDEEEKGWQVQLVAQAGRAVDADNYFGVASGATDGFDPHYDAPQPPDFGEYVSLSFPHPDWGMRAGRYAVDMRARGLRRQVWEVEVATNVPQREVWIAWPRLAEVPPEVQLTWVDLSTGQRRFMRTTAGYRYRSSPEPERRRFQIIAERRGANPLAITNLTVAATRAGARLTYTLSAPATVSATVYSLSGRVLRRPFVGRTGRAGLNQAVWDCSDERGRPLPNGLYLLEITALGQDGQRARAVRYVRVVR